MRRKCVFVGLWRSLLVTGILFCLSTVAAAHVSVAALSVYLEVAPGESRKASLEVSNSGKKSKEIEVYLGDWDRDIYGNNRLFKAETLPRSLARWVDLSPVRFVLEPSTSRQIEVLVTIPGDETGPHWTMIFVDPVATIPLGEHTTLPGKKGIRIRAEASLRYGIKLYQTDPTTETKKAKITNLDVIPINPQNSFLKIELEFENEGTAFLSPEGRVELRNEVGETVGQIEIKRFHTLPGAKRRLGLSYEGELPAGQYIALAVLDFAGDYLVAGQRTFVIEKISINEGTI